jgi:hypothetical protein
MDDRDWLAQLRGKPLPTPPYSASAPGAQGVAEGAAGKEMIGWCQPDADRPDSVMVVGDVDRR